MSTQIIGQEKLLEKLNSYTFETMPKTSLFIGEYGCGKHLFLNYLAEKLNLEVVEIKPDETDTATDEQIHKKLVEYAQCPIRKIYLVDLQKFRDSNKKLDIFQNKLLKFIEEPSQNAKIILIAESEVDIIPTVLNRCYIFRFEEYTEDQLRQFDWMVSGPTDLIYKVCKTPGQIVEIEDGNKLKEIYDFCTAIIKSISKANYANALSISTKINYKEDFKKFNFKLLLDLLPIAAFDEYKETNNILNFNIYRYIIKQRQEIYRKPILKEHFMLNFLDNLWRLTH